MQVEVCVQDWEDGFAEESGGQSHSPVRSRPAVATETWEGWFQKWLNLLQPNLSPIQAYELSLRLTGDREIQSLNHQYRQQDKPTDVLAFAALETSAPAPLEILQSQPLYLGDIVISIETAQRQAEAQGHPLETELAWLAAHGLLHLLGWDHPDEASLVQMLNQQQVLLCTVGLTIQTS
ncbi:rRNA maturation RNase YbeY [Kovacikia minuta CCNUW1]|uniref:rRNA maturation RNase YbeY n=1 Tax=Kovacikia minuta TaxID=2931930 RepID=UPI001CC99CCF|nr:rRNA maturation RNase YbeY [Kovacikia minuta]UBF27392.1 rRNA maturation RNase YbeY [Kovacikia minuta CCNUW1]